MKYDDAATHAQKFAVDTPPPAAGTHIGFYLAWLLIKGHGSDSMRPEVPDLRARTRSGSDVLFGTCNGRLMADDLDDDGNFFSTSYYSDHYAKDYRQVFAAEIPDTGRPADDFCAVADTWLNFDRIAVVLEQRFKQWREGRPFAELPPPRVAVSLSLAAEDAPVAPAPAAAVAEAAPAYIGAPVATMSAAAAMLHATPPLPDAMLERLRTTIDRFLRFESFLPDGANPPSDTPSLHSLHFACEFPGGWHWLRLHAVDERASGAGWGFGVSLRSLLQKLAQERAGADGTPTDTSQVALDAWWDDPAAIARTGDGLPYVAVAHPDQLPAALEMLRTNVEKRLRPLLRKSESAAGVASLAAG